MATPTPGEQPEKPQRVATGAPPEILDRGPIGERLIAASPVELSAPQWAQFARFRDLLLGWNERVNLTAITDPDAVEHTLFLNTLRMIPAIFGYMSLGRYVVSTRG